MQLSDRLINSLPLKVALGRLESERGEFLPSAVGRRAAVAAGDRYVRSLSARLLDGQRLREAEVVFAHRHGSGTRPVSDLDLDGRLLIEAFALHIGTLLAQDADMLGLAEYISPPEPGHRVSFEDRPLEDSDAQFIVRADVASFYEYVDHETLSREIVELAADVELAYAVRDLLAEIMARNHGLPQGPQGSDLLATLFLSAVDRRLVRAGVRLDRFNDDYLLRCSTLPEARQHLLMLEVELRAVGLILNHQKTQILSREKYEEGLAAFREFLAQAAIESVELPFGYTFDPDEFANIELGTADQATIETAFAKALDDPELPFEVRRRMIDGALPYLAKFGSTIPLDRLGQLVEQFPAQIRNTNLYLRSLVGGNHEDRAVITVAGLLATPVPWVQGWLVDLLARATRYVPTSVSWLRETVNDPALPWFLRSRALIAATTAGALPAQEEVAALFDGAPEANRPDIVAAVALSSAPWRDEFLRSFTRAAPVLQEVSQIVRQSTPASTL
jgi:hypothetical protein